MKTFDELKAMTDPEKLEYLKGEVEKVIAAAPPHQVLKLRALQARMDGIRAKVHNPLVRLNQIYGEMFRSFLKLNDKVQQLRTDK